MSGPRILVLEARFYDHIADGLLNGVKAELEKVGATMTLLTVPGIFELPAALSFVVAAKPGHYDGFITLGCAIKGETDHYEHISSACEHALMEFAVEHKVALGNGVLTTRNEAQALVRSDPAQRNFGGQAARACLRMVALKSELGL